MQPNKIQQGQVYRVQSHWKIFGDIIFQEGDILSVIETRHGSWGGVFTTYPTRMSGILAQYIDEHDRLKWAEHEFEKQIHHGHIKLIPDVEFECRKPRSINNGERETCIECKKPTARLGARKRYCPDCEK